MPEARNKRFIEFVRKVPGFGFAAEYDVERKFRETRLYQVAPISTSKKPTPDGSSDSL